MKEEPEGVLGWMNLCGWIAGATLVGTLVFGLSFAADEGWVYPFWSRPDATAIAVARDIREHPKQWSVNEHMATRVDGSLAIWWPNKVYSLGVCANQTYCYGDDGTFNIASRYVIYDAIRDVLAPRLYAGNHAAISKAVAP